MNSVFTSTSFLIKMDGNGKRKKRGSNFSRVEKSLLVRLIEERKAVIQNKKTDGVTNRFKEATWKEVTEIFNSHASVTKRSVKQLRLFYDNFKRRIKQKKAQNKVNICNRGGGAAAESQLDETAQLSVIEDQINALPNIYDCDAAYNKELDVKEEIQIEEFSLSEEPCDIEVEAPEEIQISALQKGQTIGETSNSKDTPSPTPHWFKRNRQHLVNTEKTEAAKVRESIAVLADERKEMCAIEVQLLKEKNLEEIALIKMKKDTERMKQANETLYSEVLKKKLEYYEAKLKQL